MGDFAGVGAARRPAPVPFATARGLLRTHCLGCHSTEKPKGSLDLERFDAADAVRKHPKVWQGVAEMIEAGEMPPRDKPQLTPSEKRDLLRWVAAELDAAAKARAGDPGFVPLRRLSNAEYDSTVPRPDRR